MAVQQVIILDPVPNALVNRALLLHILNTEELETFFYSINGICNKNNYMICHLINKIINIC